MMSQVDTKTTDTSNDAVEAFWAQKSKARNGVDWSNLFTEEDQFSYRILQSEG